MLGMLALKTGLYSLMQSMILAATHLNLAEAAEIIAFGQAYKQMIGEEPPAYDG